MFRKTHDRGKVQAALGIVTGSCGSDPLPLDEVADLTMLFTKAVCETLLKKHPRQPPSILSLLEPDSTHTATPSEV